MTDIIQIKTPYDNVYHETYNVSKEKLLKYSYFQSIFEDDPNITEITLPDLPFLETIYRILMNDRYEDDFYQPTLNTVLNYIDAFSYLGQDTSKDKQWVLETISFDGETSPLDDIGPQIDRLIRFKLMYDVGTIYQEELTRYIDEEFVPEKNKIRIIEFKVVKESHINILKRIIPYMTSFARAFTLCDMYSLDFNLITAVPLIQDIILYEYCHQRFVNELTTESVCEVYAYARKRLITFLSYFNHVYYVLLDESRNRTDGYPSFEQSFYITVENNINEKWKFDTNRITNNQLSWGFNENLNYVFYLYGNISVNDLPNEVTPQTNLYGIITQKRETSEMKYLYDNEIPPFSQRYTKLRQFIEDSKRDTLKFKRGIPKLQIKKSEQKGEYYVPGDLERLSNQQIIFNPGSLSSLSPLTSGQIGSLPQGLPSPQRSNLFPMAYSGLPAPQNNSQFSFWQQLPSFAFGQQLPSSGLSQQLPSFSQQLPSFSQQLPSFSQQLPSSGLSQQLPAFGQQLPSSGLSQQLPSSNQQLPSSNQQLPSSNQQLPSSNQQLPSSNQQLPSFGQSLPSSNQSLPSSNQSLPSSNQSLPSSNQQLPSFGQQLPSSNQQLPSSNQQLPSSNQQLPFTSSSFNQTLPSFNQVLSSPRGFNQGLLSLPSFNQALTSPQRSNQGLPFSNQGLPLSQVSNLPQMSYSGLPSVQNTSSSQGLQLPSFNQGLQQIPSFNKSISSFQNSSSNQILPLPQQNRNLEITPTIHLPNIKK